MSRRMAVERLIVAAILGSFLASCGDSGGGSASATGPGWGTATLIQGTTPGEALSPRVAMDNDGSAVAIWLESDNVVFHVWANRYTEGNGWGTAVPLENNGNGDAADLQVSAGGNGNATAVWMQPDGTRNNIWASRWSASSGWSAPVTLTDNTGDADFPHVAMDNGGNATAVWKQGDGTFLRIWAIRYAAGAGWGVPVIISANGGGNADNPRAAMDDGGNTLVVWNQDDGGGVNNIWANRHTPGVGWDPAPTMLSDNTGSASVPRIAMNGAGSAMAVWEQSDGTSPHIWGNHYAAGGWGSAILVESDNTVGASRAGVGMDAAGNAVAVWEQIRGTRLGIWSSRYSPGTGWGATVVLNTVDTGNAENPQVAMDGEGNAVAVWQETDGTTSNIRSNRYTPATGWGSAVVIEAGSGDAVESRVAASRGKAVAVWQQVTAAGTRIWANLFR